MTEPSAGPTLDILVVDDSPTYRMILARAIRGWTPGNLVGNAGDGEAALKAIEEKRPNLVLLDVSMPVLDGIETLRRIRNRWADVDVVMCSGVDADQTGLTMQALALGALDFVAKPQGDSPAESFSTLASALTPLLELALSRKRTRCLREPARPIPAGPAPTRPAPIATPPVRSRSEPLVASPAPPPAPAKPAPPPTTRRPQRGYELVAVGVSTGGPNALQKLVPRLSGHFPVPIVCVQHMPPLFTASLAERLDRDSALSVAEGRDGQILQSGTFHIAPGGHHMEVVRASDGRLRLSLSQTPPVHSCRPSVDVLFRSVAALGLPVLSVVLTGMGADGAEGSRLLREKGGWSIIQDEATSVVWGMPGAVHQIGADDEILPLEAIAPRLEELLSRRAP